MLRFKFLLFVGTLLSAAEFKSPKECVLGLKVADREKLTGKVLSVDSSTCYVQMDGTGKKGVYLFWMLHAAGGSAATDDKLPIGRYECWVGSNMTGGMEITSPATYSSDGKPGKFHVEASRKIFFDSGPYSSYSAKLLPGPRIGMNLSGGTFYNMTCDPVKK